MSYRWLGSVELKVCYCCYQTDVPRGAEKGDVKCEDALRLKDGSSRLQDNSRYYRNIPDYIHISNKLNIQIRIGKSFTS